MKKSDASRLRGREYQLLGQEVIGVGTQAEGGGDDLEAVSCFDLPLVMGG